jgi:hypothetical protein
VGTYGVVALRDGALWGYATFAVVVSVVVQPRHLRAVIDWYRRLIPAYVAWVPVLALLGTRLSGLIPNVPGNG